MAILLKKPSKRDCAALWSVISHPPPSAYQGYFVVDDRLHIAYIQPMRTTKHARTRRWRFDPSSTTFALSHAKTYLGRLIEKAARGEPVYIVRGRQRFALQYLPDIDPIPLRPPGFFANCYSREEILEDNLLSKASTLRPPKDLE
ncbi:MAG: hypothetical protein GX456_12820 [Verrucomicrobia bacterium]|nr:hypothetical protein [Verrucomicrobiota bacterium]